MILNNTTMSKTGENENIESHAPISDVVRSCFECKNQSSAQFDIICYVTCSVKNRDWTFGDDDSVACEEFLED